MEAQASEAQPQRKEMQEKGKNDEVTKEKGMHQKRKEMQEKDGRRKDEDK